MTVGTLRILALARLSVKSSRTYQVEIVKVERRGALLEATPAAELV